MEEETPQESCQKPRTRRQKGGIRKLIDNLIDGAPYPFGAILSYAMGEWRAFVKGWKVFSIVSIGLILGTVLTVGILKESRIRDLEKNLENEKREKEHAETQLHFWRLPCQRVYLQKWHLVLF